MISSKEKKEYIILGIILLAIIWVLYSRFFSGGSAGPVTNVSQFSGGKLLPNGPNIDLQPVQDPRFKQLVPPNYPVVNRGEVGNPNPFK